MTLDQSETYEDAIQVNDLFQHSASLSFHHSPIVAASPLLRTGNVTVLLVETHGHPLASTT
jgi:hypothetical protein